MNQVFTLHEPLGKVSNPTELFMRIKDIKIDYSQENFIVFTLNTKNQVIGSYVMFKGGLNATYIDPKTIFRQALLDNANSLIVAHNHPTGHLGPSKEDHEVYNRLKDAGDIISIKVLDSIIFNPEEFYSMNGGC